jgi:hypothetical protein
MDADRSVNVSRIERGLRLQPDGLHGEEIA